MAFQEIIKFLISNLVIGYDHSLISQRIHLKLVMKHFVELQWLRFDDCLPQLELIHLEKKIKSEVVSSLLFNRQNRNDNF